MAGTPLNQAMIIARNYSNVEVVTGTNLPMLLETLGSRMADTSLEELVETSVVAGSHGIIHKRLELEVELEDDIFGDDGI